jgi:arginine/lysine/ornithine decarboxylase
MDTPIADFLRHYRDDRMVRFHVPGHKGKAVLGCESLDLTEVKGADALYESDGIIAESERNATALFGSRRTCYSTEGSSQCIRAMLYLTLTHRTAEGRPVVVAARNVHKAFVYAAAMLDFDVVWLWPEQQNSLCGCPVSAEQLEEVLAGLKNPPAAVYLTSPDYLGGMADVPALAEVAHRNGTILVVDNAHGAYLRFLNPSLHPLDLGADLCCDSAHKTLPVLTGGAYLHISKRLPAAYADHAKTAMALFGSTSPSYLTMASLDLCNRYLEERGSRLETCVNTILDVKSRLKRANWQVEESDPLRITICAPEGETGQSLAERLREERIECEYADDTHLVLMVTPENAAEDLEAVVSALGENPAAKRVLSPLPIARGEQMVSIRQALFASHELVSAEQALGRICGTPTVSCPPAIPIAVSGEQITAETVELFRYYGINEIDVLK